LSMFLASRSKDAIELAGLPALEMEIGKLTIHQISFVTPTIIIRNIPKAEADGLLPTGIFRRVYINYADRFTVLEPWWG